MDNTTFDLIDADLYPQLEPNHLRLYTEPVAQILCSAS